MALPNNILVQILESLYADFLESDECIDISKHHCSLLHPCISISKSTTFKPIYTFRLISSSWYKVFISTGRLNRYGSHRIVHGPFEDPTSWSISTRIFDVLRKSVIFRRYRVFHKLPTEPGTSLIAFFVSSFCQLIINRILCARMFGI